MATTASRLYINGFEPGVFTLRSPANGNLTIQSATVRSGSYAARLQAASGTATTYQMDLATATYSQVICRFYLYIATNPTATRTLCGTGTFFATSNNYLGLTSAGKLCLMNGSTVQATGATTLSTGVWHRIEWRINIAQQTHQARLDGSDELSATTCQFAVSNSSISTLYLGCADTAASSADLYFDDIAVDESDWVGDSKIVALAPASVSTTSGGAFSVSGAASTAAALADWTNDTTYAISGTSSGFETYTLASLPGDLVSPRGVVVHCREKTGSGSMIYSFGLTDNLSSNLSGGAFTDASFTWKDFFQYGGSTYGGASNNGVTQTFLYGNWTLDRIQSLKLKLSSSSSATGNFSGLLIQLEYVTSGSDPAQRVWLEGFEHTDLQDLAVTGTAAVSSTQAHGGSKSLRINPSGSTASYAATSSTVAGADSFIRAYVYVNAYPTSGNTCRLFSAVSFGSMGIAVRMNSSGHLQLEDATGLLGTGFSTTAIALNTWTRVEIHYHQNSSTSLANGTGELRLNGTSLQTASIKGFVTYAAYTLRLGTDLAPGAGGVDFFLDDIAIDANTWPGAGTIAELLPSGSGSGDATSWTVTGAATHWAALADSVPDGATSFVGTSTTNGSAETYTQDDLPSGATSVAGAMLVFTAAMATSATSLSVLPAASASGIIPTIYSANVGSTSYATFRHRVPWSPTTGNWSPTSVNASYLKLQLGNNTAANISSARLLVDYTGAVTNTKETTASAIIQATNVKETGASAIVQTTNTSQLTADALVTVTNVKEATADAVVQAANTRELSALALIQVTEVSQTTTDAVVQATEASQTTADAVLLATQTLEATTDGYVYSAATPTSEVAADALLAQETTSQVAADAILLATETSELSASAILQTTSTLATTADARLTATEIAEASADALLAQATTSNLAADAWLIAVGALNLSADATMVGAAFKEVVATGPVQTTRTLEATASAQLIATEQLQVASSAIVFATSTKETTSDGYVSLGVDKTFQITADAILIPTATYTREVSATAFVSVPGVTTRATTTYADAVVASGFPEVKSDGVVVLTQSSLTALMSASGSANDLSKWRLAAGERTDGASFINVGYTIPNSFTLTASVTATAIALGLDLKSGLAGESYTLALKNGSTTLTSVTISPADWSAYATTSDKAGWLIWSIPATALAPGSYQIVLAGSGQLLPLVTNLGSDITTGLTGYVLNSFLVTSDAPSLLSGRGLIVAPQIGTSPPTVSIDADLALERLFVSSGASLVFGASTSQTLSIGTSLWLGKGSVLTMTPSAGQSHTISLASGATLTLGGTTTLTGASKTRQVLIAADGLQTDTSLALTTTPAGWSAGDRIWIGSSSGGDGRIVLLASLTGATASFTTSISQAVKAGTPVINLSRSVTITGAAENARANIVISEAVLAISHATLRCLGNQIALDLPSGATGALTDLVICEGRLQGAIDGATAFAPIDSALVSVSDLSVVRMVKGIYPKSNWTHQGALLLGDLSAQDGALVSVYNVTATIEANAIAGAVLLMNGQSYPRADLSVTNRFGRSLQGLVNVSGTASEVRLSNSHLTSYDPAFNGGVVVIGGRLGKLRIDGSSTDTYWANSQGGVLLDGEITNSTSSFPNYMVAGGYQGSTMLRLVDFGATSYTQLVYAAPTWLAFGSLVASQTRQESPSGIIERTTDAAAGSYALKATGTDPLVFSQMLDRISLGAAELCTITMMAKGTGTITLGDQSVAVNSTGYGLVTISFTAPAAMVARFGFSLGNGQVLYLDEIARSA